METLQLHEIHNQKNQTFGIRTTSNTANYKLESERYNTFFCWTKTFIDVKKLALYGFYLSKPPDIVTCAFCRVQIGNWERGDNVLREHLRWSPSCPLLNRLAPENVPIDPILFDAAIPNLPNRRLLQLVRIDSVPESPTTGPIESQPHLPSMYSCLINRDDYRLITNRLASFNEWPKSMKQKPKDLSDAGFFYCGSGDAVKCFSCGGGLRDWEEDDDPWEQHALYYENCCYLNAIKSQQFITETKRKLTGGVSNAVQEQDTSSQISAVIKGELTTTTPSTESDLKMCQICFDEERCAIFMPCMHVIACVKCAYSCESCPICRSHVTSVKRIYFS